MSTEQEKLDHASSRQFIVWFFLVWYSLMFIILFFGRKQKSLDITVVMPITIFFHVIGTLLMIAYTSVVIHDIRTDKAEWSTTEQVLLYILTILQLISFILMIVFRKSENAKVVMGGNVLFLIILFIFTLIITIT